MCEENRLEQLRGKVPYPNVARVTVRACDTMHQNQWIAAIAELEADELETTPCSFPQELELQEISYQFWNCSEGPKASRAGGPAGLPRMAGVSSST